MTKLKIILDSNTINALIDCPTEDIETIAQKCELLNCDTLKRELENTKKVNPELYEKAIIMLNKFNIEECFIFGFADWNDTSFNENSYGFLDNNKKNKNLNVKMLDYETIDVHNSIHPNAFVLKKESDRQIAQVGALHNVDILVTNDVNFYKHSKKTSTKTMNFTEFYKFIKKYN